MKVVSVVSSQKLNLLPTTFFLSNNGPYLSLPHKCALKPIIAAVLHKLYKNQHFLFCWQQIKVLWHCESVSVSSCQIEIYSLNSPKKIKLIKIEFLINLFFLLRSPNLAQTFMSPLGWIIITHHQRRISICPILWSISISCSHWLILAC